MPVCLVSRSREAISNFTRLFFPNRTWHNISCAEFYGRAGLLNATSWRAAGAALSAGACEALKSGDYNLEFEPMEAVQVRTDELITGERVCTVDAEARTTKVDTHGWYW
jgi:hypothetical protein